MRRQLNRMGVILSPAKPFVVKGNLLVGSLVLELNLYYVFIRNSCCTLTTPNMASFTQHQCHLLITYVGIFVRN
jgi:hypothetical protein